MTLPAICPHCHLPTVPLTDPVFNDQRQRINANGESMRIGAMQWSLLMLLRRRPNMVFETETLIRHLYNGLEPEGGLQVLRSVVMRLRNRMRGSPYQVKTVHGVGYSLVRRDEK